MFDDRAHGKSPEQDLWQSVLLAIVQDALFGGLRHIAAKADAKELEAIRRADDCQRARDYLTKPSRDLSIVCALAGLDMRAVIEHMTRQIAGAPSPEELSTSTIRRCTVPKKPQAKAAKVPMGAKRYTYEGESLTLEEWAERTGLSVNTLKSRLSSHWPIERVLTEPRGQRVKRPRKEQPRPATAGTPARTLTHAGETMTLKQWAARLGLSKGALDKRLRFLGMSVEEALTTPRMRRKILQSESPESVLKKIEH